MLGRALSLLGVAAIGTALYAGAAELPLVWDDVPHIERATTGTWRDAVEPGPAESYFRPFVFATYRLQHDAGAGAPGDYHRVNVGLHAAAAVLVVVVGAAAGLSPAGATVAGGVFAAHPVMSASVVYVSGRTDLLAAICVLAAIGCVLGVRARSAGARATAYAAAAALCVGAALAKESGIAAAPLCAGAVWMGRDDDRRAEAVGTALAFVGLFALLLARAVPGAALSNVALQTRFDNAGATAVALGRLWLWPVDLHMDRLVPVTSSAWERIAAAAVLAAVVASLGLFAVRSTAVRFAALTAVVLYLPISNFVPVYPAISDSWAFAGDQFLYLPAIGLAWLTGALFSAVLDRATGSRAVAVAAGAAAVCIGVALAARPAIAERIASFSDEEKLFTRVLAHSPSPRACIGLGEARVSKQDYAGAVAAYRDCAKRHPGDAGMLLGLATAYQLGGDRAAARMAYATAISLDDENPLTWSNLASLEAGDGDYAAAERAWRRALSIDGRFGPAIEGLAKLDAVRQRLRQRP